MILTSAEPHGKTLVTLFIDGEKAFDLDLEVYLKAGLRPGDDLTDEFLHRLAVSSDARRAEQKALNLLAGRAHSEKELERKLSRSVSPEAAGRAAAKMAELGLVDDERYARSLARELFSRKGYAASRVRLELIRRGIECETAGRIASEDAPEPRAAAKGVLSRKYARCLGDEKGRRRSAAALQRMGYRWEDIRAAMREIISDGEE